MKQQKEDFPPAWTGRGGKGRFMKDNTELLEQLEQWNRQGKHQLIADAVGTLPEEQRDYEIISRFARALNNLERYDEALQQLALIEEQGEGDSLLHYRKGYALYYLKRYQEAKCAFGRAAVLAPEDEDARAFLKLCDDALEHPDQEGNSPEIYSEKEMEAVEAFIAERFGEYQNVFHEIVSPDIHVDICLVDPTPERDYYTLVTMGMGARRMNVPEELREEKLERAELLICLPRNWPLPSQEEKWYWPLRWLKILARLPGNEDSWLGWGHTVPNGEPFAENTRLSGVVLVSPGQFGEGAHLCRLPDGEEINFYQVVPIYDEEMDYKLKNGADALVDLLAEEAFGPLDVERPNACLNRSEKAFVLKKEDMKPLLQDWEGPAGCLATDRILVDGCKVGYMYREEPDEDVPDSGWRFLSGDETEAYMDDAAHTGVYALNTICNYDPDVLPFLNAPYGTAFARDSHGKFQELE